jgi:type II secretory pathway pseudopilin PulG
MENNIEITFNTYKKGISLLVLIITIVVIAIIVGAVITSTGTAISQANITTFASDLKQIQDATEGYYIVNGTLPSLDGSNILRTSDLLLLSNNNPILNDEITINGDTNSDFYVIDLSKINVTRIAYGTGNLGPSDIFVVAFPTMNVYYVSGLYSGGDTYFSLTSKIANVTNIPSQTVEGGKTSIVTSGGIQVTQITGWTNKMGVNIQVDMEAGETLYMSVSDGPNRQIATVLGRNSFGFNLLSGIVADTETIKVPSLTIQEANSIEQGILPISKRYVDILKYRGSNLLGKVRINLSNFTNTLPVITNAYLSSYQTINTVTLELASTESGIEEVRYEYLTKFTDNATIENYYDNISDFDVKYMTTNAKHAKITPNLTTTISAPKNVHSIKVAVIDKAKNVNLYNQIIAPKFYIGYILDNDTIPDVRVTANIYSDTGVKDVTFAISEDSINFTEEQTYTMDVQTSGITTIQSAPFNILTSGTKYLKITASNYTGTITETRTIKIELKEEEVYGGNRPVLAPGMIAKRWNREINSWETVENPDTDLTWYNYKLGIWANAQTADGSMWVWIPRYIYRISNLWHNSSNVGGIIDIQFTKGTNDNWNYKKIGYVSTTSGSNKWVSHPAFKFGDAELTGIWVAKFEASGDTYSVNIKPGIQAITHITIDEAFESCRQMETNSKYGWGTTGLGIDTHLIKNSEWGAAVYLGQSIYGNNRKETAVNDNSLSYTGGGTGLSYINNVRQSITGNIYGIYDMSGGVIEFTAAYVNNENKNLRIRGTKLLDSNSKYRDVYTVTSDSKENNYLNAVNFKGDAIYETSGTASAWYNDMNNMPYGDNPFFTRGQYYNSGESAGIFAFDCAEGKKDKAIGYRPVLVIDNTL